MGSGLLQTWCKECGALLGVDLSEVSQETQENIVKHEEWHLQSPKTHEELHRKHEEAMQVVFET